MRFVEIVIALAFVFAVTSDADAQEWFVDRVVQPSHYIQNEMLGRSGSENGDLLLIAARTQAEHWLELKPGMTVPNDSVIRTGETGRLQLRRGEEVMQFKPGTMASVLMWEHEGSTLTYIEQIMGTLLLDVETRETKHTMVETRYLAAVVKGTRFTVQFEHDEATLRVEHGVVEAIDIHRNERVDVRPRQSVRRQESSSDPMMIEGPGVKGEITRIPFQFFSSERRKGSLLDDASFDDGPSVDVRETAEVSDSVVEFIASGPGLSTDIDLASEASGGGVLGEEYGTTTAAGSSEVVPGQATEGDGSSQGLEGGAGLANATPPTAGESGPRIGSLAGMIASPVTSNRDPLTQWQAALTQGHWVSGGHGETPSYAPSDGHENLDGAGPLHQRNGATGGEDAVTLHMDANGDGAAPAGENARMGRPTDGGSSGSAMEDRSEGEAHAIADEQLEPSGRRTTTGTRRLVDQMIDGDNPRTGGGPGVRTQEGAAEDFDEAFYVFKTGDVLLGDEIEYNLLGAMDGVFQVSRSKPTRIWLDSATIMSLIESNDPFLSLLHESSTHDFADRFMAVHRGHPRYAAFGFTAIDERASGYRHLMHMFGPGFFESSKELAMAPAPVPIPMPAILLLSAILGLSIFRPSTSR